MEKHTLRAEEIHPGIDRIKVISSADKNALDVNRPSIPILN